MRKVLVHFLGGAVSPESLEVAPVKRSFKQLTNAALMTVVAGAAMASGGHALAQPKGAPAKGAPAKGAPVTKTVATGDKGDKKCGDVEGLKKKATTANAKKDAAKKFYKDAETRLGSGDFECATVMFKAADELVPGAMPKYKVAVSIDKQNKVQDAVAAYEAFLAGLSDADKEKRGEQITDAKGRVEALKKTPGKVKVSIDPATAPNPKFLVDGAPQPGPELTVPPGKRQIGASADGFQTATQELEVAFADVKEVTLKLTEKPAEPVKPADPVAVAKPEPPKEEPKKPEPKKERSKIPAIVTLGLAGVGAVVGVIFGVQALDSKGKFDAGPTTELADETDRNALIADMSFAVAITFAVTGTVLLLTGDDKPEEKKAASGQVVKKKKSSGVPRGFLAPVPMPNGGGAVALIRF